jgi:hypothetical protein
VETSSEILIYQTDDGQTKVEVVFDGETVWLTQAKLAELFQTTKQNISKHIGKIFNDGELDENSVVNSWLTTAADKKEYNTQYYNLDLIIALGYRIDSHRGIQFRKWATNILKEYMRKGFAMNDDLLKKAGGGDYFRELLDRIRDIRSSEKVFYRQVLDIYSTSIDYDPYSTTSVEFFKMVQNKMHFAVHGYTAAELIMQRADSEQPFMGLTAFKGNRPKKSEVILAKNYLSEDELKDLNLLVSGFLDFAERQARRRQAMYMTDWTAKLDDFLRIGGDKVLLDAGRVSHEDAIEHAEEEYEKYKTKSTDELTQVEKDFLEAIKRTQQLLEGGAGKLPKEPKD